MISIQQMHYLVVLSEEKQFQKASERCFVTQPTLSMQMQEVVHLARQDRFNIIQQIAIFSMENGDFKLP